MTSEVKLPEPAAKNGYRGLDYYTAEQVRAVAESHATSIRAQVIEECAQARGFDAYVKALPTAPHAQHDYLKEIYAYLESTGPEGISDEAFRNVPDSVLPYSVRHSLTGSRPSMGDLPSTVPEHAGPAQSLAGGTRGAVNTPAPHAQPPIAEEPVPDRYFKDRAALNAAAKIAYEVHNGPTGKHWDLVDSKQMLHWHDVARNAVETYGSLATPQTAQTAPDAQTVTQAGAAMERQAWLPWGEDGPDHFDDLLAWWPAYRCARVIHRGDDGLWTFPDNSKANRDRPAPSCYMEIFEPPGAGLDGAQS